MTGRYALGWSSGASPLCWPWPATSRCGETDRSIGPPGLWLPNCLTRPSRATRRGKALTKGPRRYDWAWQPLWRLQVTAEEQAWGHWLLVRRSLEDPVDLAYYVAFAPRQGTALETLIHVAGRRGRPATVMIAWPIGRQVSSEI